MKTNALFLLIIATVFCGCATVKKDIASGQALTNAKRATSAALSAGSIVAPEYAAIFSKVKKVVEASGASDKLTQAQVEEFLKAAGYGYAYTVFFDGAIVTDFSRFSFERRWLQKGTGRDVDPTVIIGAETESTTSTDEEIDPFVLAITDAIVGE